MQDISGHAAQYLQQSSPSSKTKRPVDTSTVLAYLSIFGAVIVAVAFVCVYGQTKNTQKQKDCSKQAPQTQTQTQTQAARTQLGYRQAHAKSTNSSENYFHKSEGSGDVNDKYVIGAPLRWDTDEGAFMISLGVGYNRMELVFDTGSSQVSVKGEGCQWTSCEETANDGEDVESTEVCVVQNCPLGGEDNVYKPTSGKYVQPGENGAGTSVVLTYGSQEDTVKHYVDTIYLTKLPPSHTGDAACDMLLTSPNLVHARSLPQHAIENIIVHNVTAIKGTSTSNLFGFSRAPINDAFVTENGAFALIEQIFGGAKGDTTHRWTLVLRAKYGWLLMGAPPLCFNFSPVDYVPLVTPTAFKDFVTHFYIIPILSFETGPSLDKLRKVARQVAPTHCIIDTGTTLTYGSPKLGPAMRALGYNEADGVVRITLGNNRHSGTHTLTYTPDMLVDPEFPGTCLLQVDPATTMSDYNSIFNGENVLLFGILMMTHSVWDFDMPGQRVGIKRLA